MHTVSIVRDRVRGSASYESHHVEMKYKYQSGEVSWVLFFLRFSSLPSKILRFSSVSPDDHRDAPRHIVQGGAPLLDPTMFAQTYIYLEKTSDIKKR